VPDESAFFPQSPRPKSAAYPQDAELPDRYKRLLDPYIALSFVAATTDIEIGTCVSLVGR